MYSKWLRFTVQHCLIEDYRNRISSGDLLDRAMLAAATYNNLVGIKEDWLVIESSDPFILELQDS